MLSCFFRYYPFSSLPNPKRAVGSVLLFFLGEAVGRDGGGGLIENLLSHFFPPLRGSEEKKEQPTRRERRGRKKQEQSINKEGLQN